MDWLRERGLRMGAGAGVSVVGGGQSRTMGERRKLSQQSGFGKARESFRDALQTSPHICAVGYQLSWLTAGLAPEPQGGQIVGCP